MLELKKFKSDKRKVEGVRINKKNAKEVAKWCGGSFVNDGDMPWHVLLKKKGGNYILTTGWWVFRTPGKRTFSIATDNSFKKTYKPA